MLVVPARLFGLLVVPCAVSGATVNIHLVEANICPLIR